MAGLAVGCSGADVAALEQLMTVVPCEAHGAAGFQVYQDAQSFGTWLQARKLDADSADSVDFSRHLVLIADFGAQPNPAWSIDLPAATALVADGQARVEVKLRPPAAGRRIIQRVTHPCAVYLLQRKQFSSVAFVDGMQNIAVIALER